MSRRGRKGLGETDEGRLLDLLGSALPADREPSAQRVEALRATAERHREARLQEIGPPASPAPTGRRRMGRRGFLLGGLAASVGAAVGVGATEAVEEDGSPTEAIALADVAPGVQASAELINHTCRMSGAVLREDLEEIEILDGDGAVVLRSRLV